MKLVNVKDYGIKGINYYWDRREKFNLTQDELRSIGIISNYAFVDEILIPKLIQANELLRKQGCELIVKDGYRSLELYELVREKRYESDGRENTDRTFNAENKPHASGRVVDLGLSDMKNGKEVEMWDKKDWPEGVFIDFYKNKKDPRSKEYQKLQELLIETMLNIGFQLGIKKEFWHFELL